jgi:Fe-S-cluster-containing dehydrogenase component
MKKGLSRRDLLAGTGAALGAAIVAGTAGRKALGAAPGKGVARWGIAVDLTRCASRDGCRRCIDACHAVHRVPTVADPRHEVKWVWTEPFARVFPEQIHSYEPEAWAQSPVLVLCNHCKNAPCTTVCPTGATWRRSDGAVAMDEHRCIGCRYCMAACPYGSRSFNWENPRGDAGSACDGSPEWVRTACAQSKYPARAAGVVEKCNLCTERIDAGQVPLCVETCRNAGIAALTCGDLEDAGSPLRQLLATRQVLRRRPSLGTEPRIFYLV